MKKEQAEQVVELLHDFGLEAEIREGYGGRGMGTQTTTGVISSNVLATAYAIGQIDEDGDFDIRGLEADSMGLQSIVY